MSVTRFARNHHQSLLLLCLAMVALLPRLLDLGGFVTDDEATFWLHRSERFLNAIRSHDFAATAISVHPGVTTMWLGSIGILLRRGALAMGIVGEVPFPLLLALMRLPGVLVHVAAIVLGLHYLRRLFPSTVAILAALFWATDPFLIGYSRLLHVDALAASFAALCILALCEVWRRQHTEQSGHIGVLICSAVWAGLAILSKSPALALLPVVLIVLILAYRTPRHIVVALGIWGAAFLLTLLIVWPAMWANPSGVIELLRFGVEGEGAEPHMTGNFFLGREDPQPGLLFYPVALVLRMTPWAMVGVLLLPFVAADRRYPLLGAEQWRSVSICLVFVLLFIVAMSVFPKKFNRYLVVIFPLVSVLAAVALGWLFERSLTMAHRWQWGWCVRSVGVLAIVGTVAHPWLYHPYSIAYFNEALGGPQAGAQTFVVGWGEGLEQVAAWLNQQPDRTGVVSVAIMTPLINPYLEHGVQAVSPRNEQLPEQSGYLVVYIYQAQGTVFPPFNQFFPHAQPLHIVTIHGVPYAWIYQVPPHLDQEFHVAFGETIRLVGMRCPDAGPSIAPGEILAYQLVWQAMTPIPTDLWLFVHLVDAHGNRIAQLDMPQPTSTWNVNRFMITDIPLALPSDIPPGHYELLVGWYNSTTGTRLWVNDQSQDILYLGTINVE